MKKAYLAISYSKRKNFTKEINALKTLFHELGIELLVFVDKYNFKPNQEQEMMQTAFNELDSSDMIVAELSTKSIGVGIEIGYAYANRKTIFYLYNNESTYSTTASGTANVIINYKDELDLLNKMKIQLQKMIRNIKDEI